MCSRESSYKFSSVDGKHSDFIDFRSSENSSTTKPKSFLESLHISKQTQDTFFSSLNNTFGRKFKNILDCRAFPSVENIAISQTAEAQKIRQLQNPNHFQNRLTFLNKLSDFIDCRSSENSSTTKPKSFLESLDICKQTQNILQQFE